MILSYVPYFVCIGHFIFGGYSVLFGKMPNVGTKEIRVIWKKFRVAEVRLYYRWHYFLIFIQQKIGWIHQVSILGIIILFDETFKSYDVH